MIHQNSLLAYRGIEKDKRCQDILSSIEKDGPGTDREIAYRLGYKERNATAPRITEMIEDGILKECGTRRDFVTNKSVRVVRITRPEENLQPELF